jgi:hypothetical protein
VFALRRLERRGGRMCARSFYSRQRGRTEKKRELILGRVGMHARHRWPECQGGGAIEVVVVVRGRPCSSWRDGKGVRKWREEKVGGMGSGKKTTVRIRVGGTLLTPQIKSPAISRTYFL